MSVLPAFRAAARTLALTAVLCHPAMLAVSEAAISKPLPRAAMEKANAENAKKEAEEKEKESRAASLERLRQQYPDLDIPDNVEIVWADPVDSNADEQAKNDPNAETDDEDDLFAEFSSSVAQNEILADAEGAYLPSSQELQDARLAQLWMDVQEDLDLREIDRKAISLVREFAEAKHAVPPTPGQNGAVTYNFGDHIPRIVCRMNRVTDISLEAGENVTGVHMGDTVRWQIAPSKSGAGETETVHVIVKPLVPDISTNLVVMTDRRTYNLDLVASTTEFIPSVRFAYPDEVMASWGSFIKERQSKAKDDGISLAGNYRMSPDDLYFGYKILKGSSYEWAPVRIFDDGVKTYIEMPAKYKAMEAPVVMYFEGKQKKIVNYRVKDRFYIVDGIMSGKASLMLGQKQVVIQRTK
jgi:type IV secretion system protein VirB9